MLLWHILTLNLQKWSKKCSSRITYIYWQVQGCHKHAYMGWTSTTSVSVITSSVGIWQSTTTRGVPKLTSPIEVVTVSMYIMLVTSSWHILLNVSMVTAGPTKRPGDISSHGTLTGTCGGWSLIKEQAMSLKPGGSILFWETGLPGDVFAFSVKILGTPVLLASCFIAGMMRGFMHPRGGGKWPQGWALLFWLLPSLHMDFWTSSSAAPEYCNDGFFYIGRGIVIQNILIHKGDEGFHHLPQFPYTGHQLIWFTCPGQLSFLSPKLQCLCICQSLS